MMTDLPQPEGSRRPIDVMPTFKKLESPRSQHLTPEMVGRTLEQQKISGFPTLTPAGFIDAKFASFMGDSSYGARIGMVKKILAMSMYSPDEVKKFCETVSKKFSKDAPLEGTPGALPPQPEDLFRIAAYNPELARPVMEAAYETLGHIVDEVKQKWPDVSSEDILRLVEIDHYFSGKFNGTGIDVTFADPQIRQIGADLQQVVERIWNAPLLGEENYEGKIRTDSSTPLSENELFPIRGGIPESVNTDSDEYSPFHPDLDEKYPINTIRFTQESKDMAIRGEVSPFQWVSLFRNSPAGNMEADAVIGVIVIEAMRAGQWVDIVRPEDEQLEVGAFDLPQGGKITPPSLPLEYKRGAQKLADAGLVTIVRDQEGRAYIRPSEKLTEFVNQRIGFDRPPKDLDVDPNLK